MSDNINTVSGGYDGDGQVAWDFGLADYNERYTLPVLIARGGKGWIWRMRRNGRIAGRAVWVVGHRIVGQRGYRAHLRRAMPMKVKHP